VTATKVRLQMHLTSNGRDLAIIGQMKSHLMTQLLHYFTVTDSHAAATLLDSRLRKKRRHLILRQEASQHFELRRMMTECVQNEQDENDDQDASQEPLQKRRLTVDEKGDSAYAEKLQSD